MSNPPIHPPPGPPRSVTPSNLPRQPPPHSPLSIIRQNRDRRPHSSASHTRPYGHHEMSPQSQHYSPSPPPQQNQGNGQASPSLERQHSSASNKNTLEAPMERFNFDDFRIRYDAVMETHMARDKELVEKYKRVASTFQAWVSVLGQFDQETDRVRRDSQIVALRQKEEELEAYRKHGQAAVQDIQSILERIGSMATPRAPSRHGFSNMNPNKTNNNSNQNSNSNHAPRPASRNAAPAAFRNPQQQHRLGRGFLGSKVPGPHTGGNVQQ